MATHWWFLTFKLFNKYCIPKFKCRGETMGLETFFQHPVGPKNLLKTIDFTDPGGGGVKPRARPFDYASDNMRHLSTYFCVANDICSDINILNQIFFISPVILKAQTDIPHFDNASTKGR